MARNNKAENAASVYLRNRGFLILSRNRKIGNVEIDIIAKPAHRKKEIYFIEVKQIRKKRKYSFFPPFSRKQTARYELSLRFWYSQIGRCFPAHISLIVFDENLECVDFFPDYFFFNQTA